MKLVVLAGAAIALQSTRYAPPAEDADEEAEQYSELWENATEPGRQRYEELIAKAVKLLDPRTGGGAEQRTEAQELLVEATEILPGRAEAWARLGLAREQDGAWSGCRDALDRAWAIDPRWDGAARTLGVAVGVCRSRAGDLDGAAEVLERLVARGDEQVETLWRLGEVYMALGRLDDAEAVLEVALDQTPADIHYVHAAWTMAVVADRALDPEATRDAAAAALRQDPERTRVLWPQAGFLPPTDASYYEMVADGAAGAEEEALLAARRYQLLEPDGPWSTRVAQHLKAHADFTFADRVSIKGTEPGDAAAIRKAVGGADDDFQACLEKTPRIVLSVAITEVGPPPKENVKNLPKAGAKVTVVASDEDLDAGKTAIACVEKAAAAVKLPRPAVAGTYTTATVPLIYR